MAPNPNQSPHDVEKVGRGDHAGNGDINDSPNLTGDGGGAALGRQVSIQLSSEQYERLFFQPGGPSRGDAAKRYGNPTLLGIIGFLCCLTPTSFYLMGWRGSGTTSPTTIIGSYYFMGGLCMNLAAVGEFMLGNTFPMVVFSTFGSFWLSFATFADPLHNIAGAYTGGIANQQYNSGFALYCVTWAVVCFVYLIAGLRTNIAFEVIFFTLVFAFSFLAAGYFKVGYATTAADTLVALRLLKAAGAFAFVTCMSGFYLAIVLACASTGVPMPLPVGDLSNFLQRRT